MNAKSALERAPQRFGENVASIPGDAAGPGDDPGRRRDPSSRHGAGKASVPAVLAEPRDRETWRVLCPYCSRWHFHGRGQDGNLTGFRLAHCRAGSYRLVRRGEVPRGRG